MCSTAPLKCEVLLAPDSYLWIEKEDGTHVFARFREAAALAPKGQMAGSKVRLAVHDATERDSFRDRELEHAIATGSVVPIRE